MELKTASIDTLCKEFCYKNGQRDRVIAGDERDLVDTSERNNSRFVC